MKTLLVEDNDNMAKVLLSALQKRDMDVDRAADGEQALELVSNPKKYDVILLDVMLPKKNGFQVCKQLRTQGVQCPILMISGKSEIENRIQGLESGADDYILKPFNFQELMARIQAVKRRVNPDHSEAFVLHDLVIDFETHSVFRGEDRLFLSEKQYLILQLLAEHVGKVVSREDILKTVWGKEGKRTLNLVDVHVCNLRNKINQRHSKELICTIRGNGYLLE